MKMLRLMLPLALISLLLGCSLDDPYEPDPEVSYRNLLVPGDYASIAEAVAEAEGLDTIRVAPGDFDESFTLPPNISLFGAAADLTFINGKVTIVDSDYGTRFEGVCISNGAGSGLLLVDSHVQVAHCCIVNCLEAGVEIVGNSASEIEGCHVTGNETGVLIRDASQAGHYWDGQHLVGSAPRITGSNLFDNGGEGLEAVNIEFRNISQPDTVGVGDNYWGDFPAGATNADRTILDQKDGSPHLNGLADTEDDTVLFKPQPHHPLDWEWDD